MMPMPMPALNSMANQEKVEKSGSESSGPSLMLPMELIATPSAKTIKTATAKT